MITLKNELDRWQKVDEMLDGSEMNTWTKFLDDRYGLASRNDKSVAYRFAELFLYETIVIFSILRCTNKFLNTVSTMSLSCSFVINRHTGYVESN
jgi:hypothetical protein